MGIYLSSPDLRKHSSNGSGNGFKYGVSEMQGWRIAMEDAHITNPEFDTNTALDMSYVTNLRDFPYLFLPLVAPYS